MLCVKCGKSAEGSFCKRCLLEKEDLFEIKDFTLNVCDCGSYFDGSWKKAEDIEYLLNNIIRNRIKTRYKLSDIKLSLRKIGDNFSVKVRATGFIDSYKKTEERTIAVRIKKKKCETCSKLLGGYYEAVIQIRGNYEKIIKEIKNYLPKTARIEKTRHGYDIRFMRKSEAARLAKNLKRYKIKKSFKLVGSKKGQKLYRNYYSVR